MPRFDETLPDGYRIGRWMQTQMSHYRPTVEEREAALPPLRTGRGSAEARAARQASLAEYADRRARLVALPHFEFATPEVGPVDWMALLGGFVEAERRGPRRGETWQDLGLGDYYKRLRAAGRGAHAYQKAHGLTSTAQVPMAVWVALSDKHKVDIRPSVIAAVAALGLDLTSPRP
jgi:hypothetical protein